jgi:hypothetical protein
LGLPVTKAFGNNGNGRDVGEAFGGVLGAEAEAVSVEACARVGLTACAADGDVAVPEEHGAGAAVTGE